MESILQPPRITSLNPRPLRIVVHTSLTARETIDFPAVFPSETVFQIKQRIAVNRGGLNPWMPRYQFLARASTAGPGEGRASTANDDQYSPADVRWPFPTVRDPLRHVIDPRLYADGERKVGNPVLLRSLLLADVFGDHEPPETRVLHCWNLKTIHSGEGTAAVPTGEEFIGFYQLYFPQFLAIQELTKGLVDGDQERATLLDYVGATQENLMLLDTILKETSESAETKVPTLHQLRQITYELPTSAIGSVELLFYNTGASSAIPFLRYFPSHARVAPLVKQYTPALADRKLFEALLYDQPAATTAVLLMKVPITPRAPFGVAWTLRVTSDEAEVSMGAPRRDMPLKQDTVRRAFEQLGPFLDASRVFSAVTPTLSALTATYAITSRLPEKPTKRDWKIRLRPFLTLFHSDVMLRGDKADFSLRYKAVSNYRVDTDPKQAYLTMLFLRDATATDSTIPVASYISALVSEFGIGAQEATDLVTRWVENDAKAIVDLKEGSEAERERYIKLHPTGISVSLYNNHPHYFVDIKGCDSEISLQRILSLMAALVLLPTERFLAATGSAAAAAAAAPETVEAPETAEAATAEVANPESAAMWNMLNLGEGGEVYEAEDAGEAAASSAEAGGEAAGGEAAGGEAAGGEAASSAAADSTLVLPLRLTEGETIKPISDKWYISQYRTYDDDLFDLPRFSEGAVVKPYSTHCQGNGHQQPNLMTPEEYARARALYGNSVFWLETPPSIAVQNAIKCADESPAGRYKLFASPEKGLCTVDGISRIVEMEALALSHGFPLNSDRSIVEFKKAAKLVTEEQRSRIAKLEEDRRGKDLWVVARAGTKPIPNYYICAEFWCVRDTLPLISSEFKGTAWHDKRAKDAKRPNTCPFCGGSPIEKRKGGTVMPGETVIVRKERTTGQVAKYAGFFKDMNYHPLRYALPCCFTTLASIFPPAGTVYPALKEEAAAAAAAPETSMEEPVAAKAGSSSLEDEQNRRRPFSPKSVEATKRNPWYIPVQTVVGRNRERTWIDVERGGVAVPPAAVNHLFGQDPDQFLTKKRGVGDLMNTHLATNATAFVRYGLEHSPRDPGVQFVSLLCYADYACRILTDPSAIIEPPEERLDFLLGEVEEEGEEVVETEHTIAMIRGLEQAGYGTLLHEMSKPGDVNDGVLGRWCTRLGIEFNSSTTKAESKVLYLAWKNFRNYVRSRSIPKDLRLWDSLLACPGLLTPTGVILVVVRVSAKTQDKATFLCPSMGVAFSQQRAPPPFLFLMMDEETGQYDPLVLYESKREAVARGGAGAASALSSTSPSPGASNDSVVTYDLFGVLQTTASFSRLAPATRDLLRTFFAEYTNSRQGCGRSAPPVHPWMPVASEGVPLPVASDISKMGVVTRCLLRDRSNRLVGALVNAEDAATAYVPLLDDGFIDPSLPSLRGETELPYTDVAVLLELYGVRLGPRYPGLVPFELIPDGENKRFVALRLQSGVTVPCEPFQRTRVVAHPLYAELEARGFNPMPHEMPWQKDAELLKPEVVGKPNPLATTSEEILAESYELLRLSFSRWLHTPEHRTLLDHIERLRQSRSVLPMWEIQKRLEYLLTPIVHTFVTKEGEPAFAHADVLRRDCLVTGQSECGGGCVWVSSGKCMIHTRETSRYKNPLRLLTVRLVDELLQTFDQAEELLHDRVSAIKPLDPSTVLPLAGDSVMFSAAGGSTSELLSRLGYDQRKPTAFTRGFTYPEEVGSEPEMLADYDPLAPVAVGAAIARDPRNAAIVTLTGYLGMTLQALEIELGRPWTSSTEDWQFVAEKRGVGVILHTVNPESHAIVVDRVVRPGTAATPAEPAKAATAERFILVNYDGRLFRNRYTSQYEIPLPELPPSVRMQLS